MKLRLEQWHLNTILGLGATLVALMLGSYLLGRSPVDILVWIGHCLVYFLLGVVLFQVAGPVLIGLLVRRFPLEWLDNSFGRKPSERISGTLNFLYAIITGIAVAFVWVWLSPMVARLPSLSEWPIDQLKWNTVQELTSWVVAISSGLFAAIGYGAGLAMTDELHKKDEVE